MIPRQLAPYAIDIYGLNKWVGEKQILHDVNLQIPFGSITGFVGPNGAGKTSTMKAILALTSVESGGGEINGVDFSQPELYLQHVGALIETPTFYPHLSARSNLEICSRLAGVSPEVIPELFLDVGLVGAEEKLFSQYSLGMKQKLGIAAALVKSPEILILDEPVNGLDPEAVVGIRRVLERHRDRGVSILISSHLLAELELISDHFIFIDNGSITFNGSKENLFLTGEKRLVVKPEYRADFNQLVMRLQEEHFDIRLCESHIEVVLDENSGIEVAADLNRKASSWGIWLNELSMKNQSLEERFFSV